MINRFREYNRELSHLADKVNLPLYQMWIDLFRSRFKYKLTFKEYLLSAYRYNPLLRKNMMSMRNNRRINKVFNDVEYVHYMENKVDFLCYFSKFIKREWFYAANDSYDNFKHFISNNQLLIAKPIDSLKGQGVQKIDVSLFSELELAGFYNRIKTDNILLEELILQHKEMSFGNSSVNTVRVFTVQDSVGEIHILKTVLRVGKGDSVVDNFCAGGVVYPVDKQTGIIEGKGIDNTGGMHLYHVDSDILMIGRRIPHWDLLIDTVKLAASKIRNIRYIGWDMVVTDNGIDIIEANHNPDTDFLEFLGENCFYNKILAYK